jgi:hypothetical protein
MQVRALNRFFKILKAAEMMFFSLKLFQADAI